MHFIDLFSQNFLSPPILFFVVGALLGWAKSPLKIPEAFSKAVIYFLMISIGLQGGLKIGVEKFDLAIMKGFFVAFMFRFLSPFFFFWVLKKTVRSTREEHCVMAMYYGSISIVTFIAGMNFLIVSQVYFEGYLIAMATLMEIPAILSGFIIMSQTQKSEKINWPAVTREVLLNPSIILLVSSFLIGLAVNDAGRDVLKSFFVAPFQGVMCFFLLEMGLLVSTNFIGFRKLQTPLLVFSLIAPVFSAVLSSFIGHMIGLSFGGATLFGILCASASYVAVPAVVHATFPKIDQSTPLSLSLGVTFPFNVMLCIPLTFHLNSYLYGI